MSSTIRRANFEIEVSHERTWHESSRHIWGSSRVLGSRLYAGFVRWVLLSAPFFSTGALAAQPSDLVWDAPAICPSQAAVLQGIERIVGQPWSEIPVPWTAAHGVVTGEPNGWRLLVIVVGVDGTRHERSLLAASCEEAAAAASVVFATSLGATPTPDAPAPNPALAAAAAQHTQPTAVDRTASAPQPLDPLPSSPPSPATTPVAPVAVAVAPASSVGNEGSVGSPPLEEEATGLAGSLGVRFGVDTSVLGQAAATAGVVGGVELQPAVLRAFANATDSVEHDASVGRGSARIALYAGGLEGCLVLAGSTLRLEGCAGAQLGALRASGDDVPGADTDSVFWSAGQGGLVLRWRRGDSGALWLDAELIVPFRKLYVELSPVELHHTPSMSGQVWLGFALDL